MQRPLAILFTALAAIAVVALAAYAPKSPPAVTNGPDVAVSIFPLYDIVTHVAGDAVDVHLMLPPNASPHTYEPTPSDVAAINDAAVVYRIGYGLDDWATDIANARTDVLTLSESLALRRSSDGIVDPHYWLTIENAKTIAALAAQDLGAHFPAYRTQFQQNLTQYLAALDNADVQIRTTLSAMENTSIVTMHDAWYYFADTYGLDVIGTFEPSGGREPTPQDLGALTHSMAVNEVTTIFVDAGESTAAVETFASDNGYTIRTVDPEGTTYESYIDLMLGNARVFSQNQ